jgi:hypothetical protein
MGFKIKGGGSSGGTPAPSGTVTSETLRYDLPEVATVEGDFVSTVAAVSESTTAAVEQGVLAILLPALEAETAQVEDVTGTEIFLGTDETHPSQNDTTALAVQSLKDESLTATEVIGVEATILENNPAMVEDVTGTSARIVNQDSEATAIDEIAVKAGIEESSTAGIDPSRLEVDVSFLWPDLLVTGTGFTNTQNMLDKSDTTFASCSSSSSGGLGTGGTEETTTCDFEVSVLDPELDDLTINLVELSWQIGSSTAGAQLNAGQCLIDYQYSITSGVWVTFFAQTAQAVSTSSLVITGDIGGDWQLIKDIKFRAIGEVRSGTGLFPVTTSAQWNYAKLRILASKDY